MDTDHTIPTPACQRPACVRYAKKEYAKLRPFLSDTYWPEGEDQANSLAVQPQRRITAPHGSSSPLVVLTPEEQEYRRLTTNNRLDVLADPRGARCTHCFATVTVRGDPTSTASDTVTCTECACPTVVATSLIPGQRPMRTLMHWRKQGYPQRQSRSDPDKAIPLQAQSMQAGSDKGGKDQAAICTTVMKTFFPPLQERTWTRRRPSSTESW